MELPELVFERYECLEGTWTPMAALGEDHFIGTVRHTIYSPGIYGYTTQVLKTIRFVVPRAPYVPGFPEVFDISSDSSAGEEEPDDMDEDPDFVPSEVSLSSMSEDDSDDSGYTLSPELSPSPEYHPGPEEDDVPEDPAPVHADGDVPAVPVVAADVPAEEEEEEDPEEDLDAYFHVPEEDIIIIDSPSDSDPALMPLSYS